MDKKKIFISTFLILILGTATFVAGKDFILPIVTDTAEGIATFFFGNEIFKPTKPPKAEIKKVTVFSEDTLPSRRVWKKIEDNETDISDFIDVEWKKINDLNWEITIATDKELKKELETGLINKKKAEEIAEKYLRNRKKWQEIQNFNRIPINLMGQEREFSLLESKWKFQIRLPFWKDGWQIRMGFGTTVWTTSTECIINTTRSYSDDTIVYNCDISVENGATLSLSNITFEWNGSYDFTVEAGSIFIMNESSLWQDHGGSGTNVDMNIYGDANIYNSQIDDYPQDIKLHFYNGTSVIDTCTWDYGQIDRFQNPAQLTLMGMNNHDPNAIDIYLSVNSLINTWIQGQEGFSGASHVLNCSDGAYINLSNTYSIDPVRIESMTDGNLTLIDSVIDQLQFDGNDYHEITNSTIEYLTAWYNEDTLNFTKPYSSIHPYYIRPSAGFEFHGYVEFTGSSGYWSTSNFKRYFPFNVTDEGGNPQSGINISLQGGNSCLTDANGYCEAFYVFSDSSTEVEIYVDDVFEANITATNNTHPDGIQIEVTGIADNSPTVTLQAPPDGSEQNESVDHICYADDDINLINVTLFTNGTGSWEANGTNTSGIDEVNYTFPRNYSEGVEIEWNCYACDNASQCSFAVSNWTFNITACIPSWQSINTTCNSSDNFTEWFNDTNGCGDTPPANNTWGCNYCSYDLVNTSWSAWQNDSVCQITDNQTQNRSLTEWDQNKSLCCDVTGIPADCYANVTHWEYQNISCNYCSPNPTNTSWSAWGNVSYCLINDTQEQRRNRTEYDADNSTCYGLTGLPSDLWNDGNNITWNETQYIGCNNCSYNLTNTSWSAWQNMTSCYPNGTLQQNRSRTEWDTNNLTCCDITGLESDCYSNVTHWEYQSANCTYEGIEIIINWTEPTANGTEAENKTYIFYNTSVTANMTGCLIEINGTNETGTYVNADNNSYCYYNKTGLTSNQTVCSIGWASNVDGVWNRTATTICRDIVYYAPPLPPVPPIFPVRFLFNYWGYSVISWGRVQGITDSSNYWLCTTSNCSSTCQVIIENGLITGCT